MDATLWRTRDLLVLGAIVVLLILTIICLRARACRGGPKDKHGAGFGRHHNSHRSEPADYYYGFNCGLKDRPPPFWAPVGASHPARTPPWDSWYWCPCPAAEGQTPDRLCRCSYV